MNLRGGWELIKNRWCNGSVLAEVVNSQEN